MHFCKNTGLLTIYLKEINSFILFIFCFFQIKGWMYISIQGNIDAGMTENFAECFDIESEFHTSGSKSMAQCMEICFWDFTSLKKLFEMILIRTGLYIFLCGTGQKISFLRKLTAFYDLQ